MKRRYAMTLLVGAGLGLTGCQAPSLGGLAFWNRDGGTLASTTPDVGKHKYNGLTQQFGSQPSQAMGQSQAGTTALGASRAAESDNLLLASWKKTSAAVSGAFVAKPKVAVPEDDPLRVDKMPKKIGPEVYVAAARLLENQGKFAEAEGKYREALQAMPSDLNALVGLARLHDRMGAGQKALDLYQQAAQAHPTSGLVFNDLGICYRRQKQTDKSLVAFRRAVELQAENPKYRNNLAGALVEAGRTDDALTELSAVNSPAVAHFNLAQLLEQNSQRNQAIQHLQQAVAIDASLTPARDRLQQLTGDSNSPANRTQQALSRTGLAAREAVEAIASKPAVDWNAYTAAVPQTTSAEDSISYHIGDDGQHARPLPPVD